MPVKYSGETGINWILQGTVAASAAAMTQIPVSITLVLGQNPVSSFRVYKGQRLELTDFYTNATQTPDCYLQIVVDNNPQPFTADLNSLYVGNQNKPKLPKFILGENHELVFYFYNIAANGSTAATITAFVSGKIIES